LNSLILLVFKLEYGLYTAGMDLIVNQMTRPQHEFLKLIAKTPWDQIPPTSERPDHFLETFVSMGVKLPGLNVRSLFYRSIALMPLRHRLPEDSQNINFSRFAVG